MHRRLVVLLSLLLFATSAFAASKRLKFSGKLSKGIKKHQDWIERFEETYDPQIFSLLASRVGRDIPNDRLAPMVQHLKENPEKRSEIFQEWGITRDPKEYNKEKVKEWEEKYKKDALIIKTTHYYILGTKVDKIICNFLKYYMEKVFKYYEKTYPTEEKIDGRFLIYIYPDRGQYLATGAPSFSGAYYSASDRMLVGYVPAEHRNARRWIAQSRISIFFHEGFHQYFGYFIPKPPIWLNEGGAMMAESILVQQRKLVDKNHMSPHHGQAIQSAMKSRAHVPLKKFLYFTPRDFYGNPDLSYPQGWSFARFLKLGPKEYRHIPSAVVSALLDGKDTKTAVDEAIKGISIEEMEEDWIKFTLKTRITPVGSTFHYPK